MHSSKFYEKYLCAIYQMKMRKMRIQCGVPNFYTLSSFYPLNLEKCDPLGFMLGGRPVIHNMYFDYAEYFGIPKIVIEILKECTFGYGPSATQIANFINYSSNDNKMEEYTLDDIKNFGYAVFYLQRDDKEKAFNYLSEVKKIKNKNAIDKVTDRCIKKNLSYIKMNTSSWLTADNAVGIRIW